MMLPIVGQLPITTDFQAKLSVRGMKMGCFVSKSKGVGVVPINSRDDHDGNISSSSGSSSGDSVGNDISNSSSSCSSSSSFNDNNFCPENKSVSHDGLVEKLAAGIHDISDDSSSESAQHQFGSPDQSIIDDIGDESVVDWLAESSTTLFTSTSVGHQERQPGYSPASSPAIPSEPESINFMDKRDMPSHSRILTTDEHQGTEKHIVKDTTHAERRHVRLPSDKPSAVKGNWLTNRYVVNDYIVLSEIGRGAHSEVRLCKHKMSNELFAVKIMNRKLLLQSKVVDFQKEVAIMKTLMHKNILALYEVIDDPKVNKVYLITEFAHRGDLMNMIKRGADISSDNILRDITRQVGDGLLYLHKSNFCHNDLKPSNILVDRAGSVKIADFGVSGLGRIRLDSAGTPAFMAPEVVSGEVHDGQKADVYALGATIFCIKFGTPPFIGRGANKNQKLVDLYEQIKHSPLTFPDKIDDRLEDLICRLMDRDPIQRIKLTDALKHPWLEK